MPPTSSSQQVMHPVAALLWHAFDYAGLYPPAALSMQPAVREYQYQLRGPNAWALGRFVVGMEQLPAFVAAHGELSEEAWPISLLLPGAAPETNVLGSQSAYRVGAVETRAASPGEIAALQPLAAAADQLFVEVPLDEQLPAALAAIRSIGARAKVRTGGVTRDAFPTAEALASFIRNCVQEGVPFKATAGLHHLIRGEYPLTYEQGSARGTMFGFLNVAVAAALAFEGAAPAELRAVLQEESPGAFRARPATGELCWRDRCLTSARLRDARLRALMSIGSCSFSEPLEELATAGFLAAA